MSADMDATSVGVRRADGLVAAARKANPGVEYGRICGVLGSAYQAFLTECESCTTRELLTYKIAMARRRFNLDLSEAGLNTM